MNFLLVPPFLQLQSAVNRWEPCGLRRFEVGATSCRLSTTDWGSRRVMLRELLVKSLQEAPRCKWWQVDFHRNKRLSLLLHRFLSSIRLLCWQFPVSFQHTICLQKPRPLISAWRSWFSAGILCCNIYIYIFTSKYLGPVHLPQQVRWHRLYAHIVRTVNAINVSWAVLPPPESPFIKSAFICEAKWMLKWLENHGKIRPNTKAFRTERPIFHLC